MRGRERREVIFYSVQIAGRESFSFLIVEWKVDASFYSRFRPRHWLLSALMNESLTVRSPLVF